MTEAETRAALRASVPVGEVEHWIAAQPWRAAPGRWEVPVPFQGPEPFRGSRFQVESVAGGVRVTAFSDERAPAAWTVPGRRG
jgi:hypothetical protein